MKTPDFTHKQHIDGLRAVAVISVVLFHLNPIVFSGGYLGVDVFFVISGFVITQSLYKNYYKTGTVNISQFYIRRFKRLYPALVAMVVATTTVYAFFGFLWDTNLFLKSAVTSILASSNLYFLYYGENYFQQDLVNPLLHTWSLGVEEQFYFIYPLLLALGLWCLKKYKIRALVLAPLFLGISILLYILFYTGGDGLFGSFYFPLARFWELGAGCALFFFSQYFPFTRYTQLIVTFSFLGIIGVQLFQNRINDLPTETLLIVLATTGVLYAGISGYGVIVGFLRHKVVTYVGRISYSLYLWHFPVIYFIFLYLSDPWSYVVASVLSFGLAVFSYHYIEQPLRYSSGFDAFLKGAGKASIIILLGILVWVGVQGQYAVRLVINNSFNAISDFIKPINYIESNFNLGERIQSNYSLEGKNVAPCANITEQSALEINDLGIYPECMKQVDGSTLFYLTGDSHAFHFLSALDNSQIIKNLYFVEIPRQSIVNEDPRKFDSEKAKAVLAKQKQELISLNKEFNDIYYVSSFFLSLESNQIEAMEKRLETYIETLQEYATMVFIAPTPVFPTGPESCVLLKKHCTINKNKDIERRLAVYDMLKAFEVKYEKVYIYDAYKEICPNEECIIYDKESDFLSFMDKDHMSVEQSIQLSPHFDAWLRDTFGLLVSP